MTTPLLEMRGISKRFPGVLALDGVSFDLQAGEIHALVGENGAGKSTLMKILGGVYRHGTYDGEILIDGSPRRFDGVRDAERAGIAVVHQELSLIGDFTIAENIFLGREPRTFGFIQDENVVSGAQRLVDELELHLDPRLPVRHLGIGQQHLVEIAKALSRDARILVLDEPTAALTDTEAEILFTILDRLRRRGTGIIYISHKLGEVFRLAARITVLRDGRTVSTDPLQSVDTATVIARMVGREVSDIFPPPHGLRGDIVLEARNVTVEDPAVPGKLLVDGVGFSVRRGEILGIAGLVGAGRTELLMALFGAHPGMKSGEILVEGRPLTIRKPADAIAGGIGLVTEDRKRFGLFLEQTIVENLTIAALKQISGPLVTDEDAEAAAAERSAAEMRVKAASVFTVAGTLSGGNQQKVVLAKWLLTNPKALLLDEPTRGIDVGAKQEIYAQIERLAAEGLAIVLVSSELPEVLGLSDRVLVLHRGRLTGEFERIDASPEAVMACATGQAA
ncbi:MAG TPA: ATP-binding cassette domain-containing protein, partial [Thermoanaerobaculia bacterium]|nr:ATP-binding cassette domain-containing protein [Thermoanaerobaculia bacterium]